MIIQIEIDCETIAEFYTHLGVIRKEVKKLAKEKELDAHHDAFLPTEWADDNCYGSHSVVVKEDEMLKEQLPPGMF